MSLRLRRPDRDDLDSIVDWVGDPAFHALFYVGDDRTSQQIGQQVLGMVGGAVALNLNPTGQFIVEDETPATVGLVSIQDLSWRNRSCSAEVYLVPANRGPRDTAEAYRAVIAYSFDEFNLHRVSVRVSPDETALHAALLSMGARREVVLRGHIARDGAPKDVYEFGVLRADFKPGALQEIN